MIALGTDPWILILLTLLELSFIFIPTSIAAKAEKTTLRNQFEELGIYEIAQTNFSQIKLATLGLIIGIFLFFIGDIIYFLNISLIQELVGERFIKNAQESAISTQPVKPSILQFIIIFVLQFIVVAVSEEIFFRAFLIKKFNRKLKPIYSVLISSIFFTLYHIPPFIVPITTIITYFGYYFILGLLLSITYLSFNYSLIQNILAHGMFNVLILLF